MTDWNDLTRVEQLDCLYSDLFKDVHGVRPRDDRSDWTEAQFEAELDALELQLKEQEAEQDVAQAQAIEALEDRIDGLLEAGARNRAMALRWLHEAMETDGQWDFLEWNLGVPYGYFASKGDVVSGSCWRST